MPNDPYRLPRTTVPTHYRLSIASDLDAATFEGTAAISVEVHEPGPEMVCNAADLAIHSAVLTDAAGDSLTGTVDLDPETERVTVTWPSAPAAGKAILTFAYSGTLNDKLRGFYRSTFTDDAGQVQVIGTTQFEATDARRAFPCWDEPDIKAVFEVELLVARDLVGLSNTQAVSERPGPDGSRWILFAPTMALSTYLVAWVVGPLELSGTVVDGVDLRVACVPGRSHLSEFALEVAAHSLRYFTEYFAIPYPGDKLDLVALPDFAFGAMENLGCVTFRETALLVDPRTASRDEFERVADVVAHEIAHMWFGDLVTMKWWNGIWLNEAFATFMEVKCVDAFRPDWERWVSFGVGRAAAMSIDGLSSTRPVEFPVVSPAEAEAMFDLLTYQKGGAVLRMLEMYLGSDRFREGIRRYLDLHRYANTETTDLWDALEEATGEPVRAMMDSWIFQGGHPEVAVELGADLDTLDLTQSRFLYRGDSGEARWDVPVMLRSADGSYDQGGRLLLTEETQTVPLGAPNDWVVVNSGGWGFFRTRYASALLQRVTSRLDVLNAIERFNLVSDTWAATIAGHTPATDFLALTGRLSNETDPSVWAVALSGLDSLDRILGDDGHRGLSGFVRELVGPAFARVGWEPTKGETDRTGSLRATLLRALGTLGADPDVRHRVHDLHRSYLTDRTTVTPDLMAPIVAIEAWNGDVGVYEEFLERYRNAATPQEEVRYLFALPAFPSTTLLLRTLESAMTEVRTQNGPFLVSGGLANRWVGATAWDWLKEHWEAVMSRFPHNTTSRMIEGVAALSEPKVSRDILDFMAQHPVPHAQLIVDQILERLELNTDFRTREGDRLTAHFSKGAAS